MSTSLLYHAFRIRAYKYSRTEYRNRQVIFTIDQEPETYRCSACGSTQVISRSRSLPEIPTHRQPRNVRSLVSVREFQGGRCAPAPGSSGAGIPCHEATSPRASYFDRGLLARL